jgi:hypothetical protein
VTGSVNAGQTVTMAVSGATANSPTVVGIGFPGATTFSFGLGSTLTIDLAQGFMILPLGNTDATGAASLSIALPTSIPAGTLPDETFTVQALTIGFAAPLPGPGNPGAPSFNLLSFCKSNTATLVSGNG